MDARLVKSGIAFTRRRKRWILAVAALACSGYGAYRVYNSPLVARKRRRFLKLVGALVSLAEAVSESSETIALVSKDLKEFLRSDSDEVPNSLKQISKIARSTELLKSITEVSRALTVGALRGYRSESKNNVHGNGGNSGFADQVLDKLFTPAGSGFASVVVGSLARNLVMAIHAAKPSSQQSQFGNPDGSDHSTTEGSTVLRWLNVLCDDKVKDLVGDCIQLLVSTAVTVYLEKTMEVNTYDDLFSGLTNPKHEKKVKEMLVSVCNGTVETLVKTSHNVLKSSKSNANSCPGSPRLAIEGSKGLRFNGVSSTLAVPSNRRLVLDVTGRVTSETVRSLLEYLTEKLYDGMRQGVNAVHEEVLDRGVEVVRYVTAKSSTITTICLSLCLHVLDGASILAPF
ncbi:protein PHLOEM PROTEIN 2-LIKE A10-like isoform X2 [Rhodamnia argentea]|uniref:Protein PHLOEM PROTEIN 2-LIKE A10-like isoform X2 n=1 Tax=Rhodamnia argentea TaxID=178133 RepID=A0ABM3H597_9MYRT|nr:protein PHLOEM PROTEIN 2-LIKE A10-like isoform X2 [Rhodamnia argentea]